MLSKKTLRVPWKTWRDKDGLLWVGIDEFESVCYLNYGDDELEDAIGEFIASAPRLRDENERLRETWNEHLRILKDWESGEFGGDAKTVAAVARSSRLLLRKYGFMLTKDLEALAGEEG